MYVKDVQALDAARAGKEAWGVFLRLDGHFLWAVITPSAKALVGGRREPRWTGSLREGHIREHPPSVFLARPVPEILEVVERAIADGYEFGEPPSAEVVSSVSRSALKREPAWTGVGVPPPDRPNKPVDPYDRIRYITRSDGGEWSAWDNEGKLIMYLDADGAKTMYHERPREIVKDKTGATVGYHLKRVRRTFP